MRKIKSKEFRATITFLTTLMIMLFLFHQAYGAPGGLTFGFFIGLLMGILAANGAYHYQKEDSDE